MKGKKMIVVIVLAGMLLALAAPVAAEDNILNCTGTEHFYAFLSPGDWKPVDGHVRVRGMMMQYKEEATCPQAAGINTVVINANWTENQIGPMWGTAHSETPYGGGGIWEGTWQGKTNADGSSSYRGVSQGVSGSVEGLIMWFEAHTAPGGVTQLTYTLRDPGGE